MLNIDKKLVLFSILVSLLSLFWGFIQKFLETLGEINQIIIYVTGIFIFLVIIILLFFLFKEYLREKQVVEELKVQEEKAKKKVVRRKVKLKK